MWSIWSNKMRYRISPKNEKRVRMDITILPSTRAKLQELQGDYSLSAVIEDCLLDYFEILSVDDHREHR
jgi:hypothetical protein